MHVPTSANLYTVALNVLQHPSCGLNKAAFVAIISCKLSYTCGVLATGILSNSLGLQLMCSLASASLPIRFIPQHETYFVKTAEGLGLSCHVTSV